MVRRERKDGEESGEGWGGVCEEGKRGMMGRRVRRDGEEYVRKDGEESEEGWGGVCEEGWGGE